MAQKRIKRTITFAIRFTVYTDFMQQLVESYMNSWIKTIIAYEEMKGRITKVEMKKDVSYQSKKQKHESK